MANVNFGHDISEVLAFPNGTLALAVADRLGVDIVSNGRSYHDWAHRRFEFSAADQQHHTLSVRAVALSQGVLAAGATDASGTNGTLFAVLLSGAHAGSAVALPPPRIGQGVNSSLAGFGEVVAAACVTESLAASAPHGYAVGTYWCDDNHQMQLMETVAPPAGVTRKLRFGAALSMTDELLFVGAPDTDNPLTGSGAVFVYRWDTTLGNWSHAHTIEGANSGATPLFGTQTDASCDGKLLAVASPCANGASACTDLVLVFAAATPPAVGWTLAFTLRNPHPELSAANSFGSSLAVDDNGMLAVGAPSTTAAGRVYIFRNGDVFATILLDDADAKFGTAIALHEDVLVVGSPRHSISTLECAGSLFMFSVSELSALVLAIVLAVTLFIVVVTVLIVLALYRVVVPSTLVALSKAGTV